MMRLTPEWTCFVMLQENSDVLDQNRNLGVGVKAPLLKVLGARILGQGGDIGFIYHIKKRCIILDEVEQCGL